MDQLPTILANYQKLCGFYDSLWKRVRKAYPSEIACREGCGICCELQSVNQLEAHVIRSYIKNNDHKKILGDKENTSACPFLYNQSCRIYAARPLICRTHGLILHSIEFTRTWHVATCPYNFPSHHPDDIPPELAIDADNATKNLTNLNLAFCMVGGIDIRDEKQSRVPLKELASLLG